MKQLDGHIDQINQKTVIVRANYDVPITDGQVQDTTRIEDSLPTIKLLLKHHNKVVLLAHYDRPEGEYSPDKSLKPVVTILEQQLGQQVGFVGYQPDYHQLSLPQEPSVILVDNLRFWTQEEKPDADFAAHLRTFGDIYVNEAFANCHRKHTSVMALPKLMDSYAGISLSHEINILTKIRNHPDKPLVIVIGGAKLETKLPLVTTFADRADHILVGGKLAVEMRDRTDLPANIIKAELTPDQKDITEASANQFAEIINTAKTVIWNGSMGIFEEPDHQLGTKIVANAINTTPAFTLVGGGDTETALTLLDMESGIDHISSGGGAMLEFLSNGNLPALEPLT